MQDLDTTGARTAANDPAPEIRARLQVALSDTAVETATLQLFHYNVRGMNFFSLHSLFEEMYKDHFAAQDTIAERIRALGGAVENRLSKHLEHASLEEHEGTLDARGMVSAACADQEALARSTKEIADFAEEHGDGVTHDMLLARAEEHDMRAWMLRAHLDG